MSQTAITQRLKPLFGQIRPSSHSVPSRTPASAKASMAGSWTLPSSSVNWPVAAPTTAASTITNPSDTAAVQTALVRVRSLKVRRK